ncbi:MAG: hypothetical protein EOO19_16415 [Chryseobacterium sp.]|nr:MAG: hypothetical protein EOO19_16415 [Chryseobacterium sp.]
MFFAFKILKPDLELEVKKWLADFTDSADFFQYYKSAQSAESARTTIKKIRNDSRSGLICCTNFIA